jgi:thiamine biosynthesis protein ThiS
VIVTLNGESREVQAGVTIAALVDLLGGGRRGVAVALSGEVVPRARWDDIEVADGDRVEVVAAIQGG